jgi:hypothetical protein
VNVLVVVPFERHVERAMQRGERALAWPRLVDALARDVLPGVRFAGPEHTRLALAEAARDLVHPPLRRARELGALSWERMLDALDDALLELRRADVDAAYLRAAASSPRALLLADVMDAVDARLAASELVDGRSREARVARALAAAPDGAQIVRASLGADALDVRSHLAFDARTAQLLRALANALGGAPAFRLELPSFAAPLDALRERDPLEILIDRAGALLGEPPETFTVARRLGDFTGDAAPVEPERVTIATCESAEGQARAALLSVMRALARGVPVEKIGIVSPTGDEETLAPLRRLAEEAGVPLYDARGPAPARAGIVAYALEALAVGPRGLPRRDVARLLRSTYLLAGKELAGEGARGKLAAIASALDASPTIPCATARESLLHTARAGLAKSPAQAELVALTERLASILERPAGTRPRTEHVAAARELFQDLGLRVRAEGLARSVLGTDEVPTGVARAELRALAADAHAWEVLHGALVRYEQAVAELAVTTPIAAEVFAHELRRALEAGPPLPGGGRAFAVRVGRLEELAFEELAHVVVLDANDGVLPRHDDAEGLAGGELAALLRDADPRRAPWGEGERGAAQLAALAVLCDRAESVLVAHRTEDDSGAALAESAFVLWLGRAGVARARFSAAPLTTNPLSIREHDLLLLPLAPEYAARLPSAQRRAERERARERWHDRIEADLGAAASEEVGLVGEDAALILAQETGATRPLSVTALERIGACPFQGFASVVLRAGEELGPEDRPDVREEGTMVHEALRVVFEGTRELLRERPRPEAAIRERARTILEAHFAAATTPLRALAIARMREEILRVLEVAIADLDWDFDRAELPFGAGDDGLPPFVVEGEEAPLRLRGTIDRVDVARTTAAVRVIDYKRSVKYEVRSDDLGITRLQIPIYAATARAAHGVPRAEGAYVPTQTPEAPQRADVSARLEELLADDAAELRRSLLRVVAPLRRGEVAPRPITAAVCARCDLDGGCRRPRFVSGDVEVEEP